MMDIDHLIQTLLAEDTNLEMQYQLVTKLDEPLFEADTLYQIAEAFLRHSLAVKNPFTETLDIVGTGGDALQTLNYSTLSALVVHHLGGKIAKHGNKSSTSKCGSFDFLERLAIKIPTTADEAYEGLVKTGFTFLFAPYFHPAFAKVAEVRKKFAAEGKRTFFNVLGPLLNPMRVRRMVVGVYDKALLEPYCNALKKMGVTHAYIVYGDGMDEFSVCGVNQVLKLENGEESAFSLHPEQLGIVRSKVTYLAAGDPFQNFAESQNILTNELLGPKQDMLVLNSAAALHVARGFDGSLSECFSEVKQKLQAGQFAHLLVAQDGA